MGDKIEIVVKGIKGETIILKDLKLTSTIKEIREKICDRIGLKDENLNIVYSNHTLSSDKGPKPLSEFGISDGSTLIVLTRVLGGAAKNLELVIVIENTQREEIKIDIKDD